MVDVAIDQGGCFETSRPRPMRSRPTSSMAFCTTVSPTSPVRCPTPRRSDLRTQRCRTPSNWRTRVASRLQGESRTGVRIERRRRKGRLQTSSGCLGTEIRTAGPVKPTPQTIQSENPAIAALPTLWSPSFRTERQSLVFFSEYEAFV